MSEEETRMIDWSMRLQFVVIYEFLMRSLKGKFDILSPQISLRMLEDFEAIWGEVYATHM